MSSQLPIRIAYADDHVMVRSGISEYINTFDGCTVVHEANNGEELLRFLETTDNPPDICILDIFMPVMNGFSTLLKIRERWPHMRVLVLTGHNTDYYLIQMLRAGANGYLQKNCSPKELETAIRTIDEHGLFGEDQQTTKYYKTLRATGLKKSDFTENEIALLKYCCSDLSYNQIADKMKSTLNSVDWIRLSLFKKLNVKSRSSLVMYAIQFGLVELDMDETGSSLVVKNKSTNFSAPNSSE